MAQYIIKAEVKGKFMRELYIGMMSGTSVDGIDVVIADFTETKPAIIATHYTPYSSELRERILNLCEQGEVAVLGDLDAVLGNAFAAAANELIASSNIQANLIKAIGSHGQTIRHAPNRFTIQIGDPNIIATQTGVTTVADFRRKDMALGGQGAPLVPAFHAAIFNKPNVTRIITNIGGIANVTILSSDHSILGFDTGPGNTLCDAWINHSQQKTVDESGKWAATGSVNQPLLKQMLADAYFALPAPKSTGREQFNLAWIQKHLQSLASPIAAEDVQATLVELTATSILDAIKKYTPKGEIYICGGGAHNTYLMQRLTQLGAPHYSIATTDVVGVHPDWVEALAFAWLAKQSLARQPGNLPAVTGASHAISLGGIYYSH